jgi:hypothetical protein
MNCSRGDCERIWTVSTLFLEREASRSVLYQAGSAPVHANQPVVPRIRSDLNEFTLKKSLAAFLGKDIAQLLFFTQKLRQKRSSPQNNLNIFCRDIPAIGNVNRQVDPLTRIKNIIPGIIREIQAVHQIAAAALDCWCGCYRCSNRYGSRSGNRRGSA